MLGHVVCCNVEPVMQKASSVCMDRILNGEIPIEKYEVPTLRKKENRWEEFWLNASDTKNWCPRAVALRSFAGPIIRKNTHESIWRMSLGKVYHEAYQKELIPVGYPYDFYGAWYIKGVNDSDDDIEDVMPDGIRRVWDRGIWNPITDEEDRKIWKYRETKIRIPDYRIVVKLDGIVGENGEPTEVWEIKTEQEDARDKLDPVLGGSPRLNHIEQLHIGMWASGIHKGRLIYVFKGAKTLIGSVLEVEVEYDESIIRRLLDVAFQCVQAVKMCDRFKEDNKDLDVESYEVMRNELLDSIPRYDECPMKSKGRAAYCYARDLCFVKKTKVKAS